MINKNKTILLAAAIKRNVKPKQTLDQNLYLDNKVCWKKKQTKQPQNSTLLDVKLK